jgi:hypothetical protein
MLKVLLYATPLILAVYAMVDLVQTKDEDVQGLPKLVWVLVILFGWVVGPIAWLIAGRRGRGFPGSLRGSPARTAGPAARWPLTTTPTSSAASTARGHPGTTTPSPHRRTSGTRPARCSRRGS